MRASPGDLLFGAFAVAFLSTAAAAEPRSHYELVRSTLEVHVAPRIAAVRTAAEKLPGAVARLCERGDADARKDVDQKFKDAVLAYAAADFLRFGPMTEAGRRESISFWPDPRGFVGRQLRQVIAGNDPAMATAEGIAKQSAAVEGLPALGILLTDVDHPLGPDAAEAYRCRLAEAIAANIAALAAAVDDGWKKPGGWKDKMLRPGSDNDTYKDPQEAASELVKAFLVGLALVADVQIKPRVDGKALAAGPYAKSNLAADFYRAEVDSLESLYSALDLESYLDESGAWMRNWASGAWRIMQASDGFGGLAANAPQKNAPSLRELFDRMTGLRKIVSREMSAAAGLTVGFNELDGD